MAFTGQPPHVPRLLDHLRGLRGPLVQVWGWPGSGRRSLLDALAAAEGDRVARMDAGSLEEAPRPPQGARWTILRDYRGEDLSALLAGFGPDRALVLTTRERLPLPGSVISPAELRLTEREVAAVVEPRSVGGGPPDLARRLRGATDGWLWPLRLALSGPVSSHLVEPTAERLVARPAVASFLRHEVLAPLPAAMKELLLELSVGLTLDPELWQQLWRGDPERTRRLEHLLERHGLAVTDPGGGPRLPTLLQVFLGEERKRRWVGAQGGGGEAGSGLPPTRASLGGPSSYRVLFFGVPKVTVEAAGGSREVSWTLRRSFKVFGYLASAPDLRASREELVEAVWGDESEETVRKNFHPTLSHLRRNLVGGRSEIGDPLLFSNGVYRLNPEFDWRIDGVEFELLASRGRQAVEAGDAPGAIADWESAWRLYRGPFLEGFWDPWIVDRREAYSRTYLDVLRRLGDAHFERDQLERAMDAYRTVLTTDPLQERIHLSVMRVHARQKRRDLVRRQYDRLTALLREELGVEPLPETTDDYHRLMG